MKAARLSPWDDDGRCDGDADGDDLVRSDVKKSLSTAVAVAWIVAAAVERITVICNVEITWGCCWKAE